MGAGGPGALRPGPPTIRRESVMRGRRPVGPELAQRVAGSDLARRRALVVLQTMTGALRVQEACAQLGISEQRFEDLRQEAIEAAVSRLEPRPAGRPPRPAASADAAEVARLRQRVAELEAELEATTVRLELAQALPRVSRDAGKPWPRPGRTSREARH